ncbi:MAG: 7-carboxy-7-deazaguanine synthase QueE [Breznakibacter sp.]
MEKLVLVEEGVFPITVDKQGNPLSEAPKTGWPFSGTVQGEGKLAGVPSLFVRMASCNLRCMWLLPDGNVSKCDTGYASFNVGRTLEYTVDDMVRIIARNLGDMHHVVISGGEPMLQKRPLAALCHRIKELTGAHITIESNATIFDADVAAHVDLVSLSPKLSNSEPNGQKLETLGLAGSGPFVYHAERRRQIEVIQKWIDAMNWKAGEFQLKFVMANPDEETEIKEQFLAFLAGFKASDILAMPLGASMDELAQTTSFALQAAVRNGWRFSPRIHIELFGCREGV